MTGPASGGSRTMVITGASDGIGAAAARRLAAEGAHVVVVGRSPAKTRAVAEAIGAPHHLVDFGDLADVRRLAGELLAAYPRIDVLANNAGTMRGRRTLTVDGFEATFQVNHLAPFLLTRLLLPRLLECRASVIQTASNAARLFARLDLADPNLERGYSSHRAYGNAKLATILFTRELHRRHGRAGIAAAAFHPGVVGTNFGAEGTAVMRRMFHVPVLTPLLTLAPETGADQLAWLAAGAPGVDWLPGRYYERRRPARSTPVAHDPYLARVLWDLSEEMLGLSGDN